MSLLCHHMRISPTFLPYVRAFGRKSFAQDEGFSGCNISVEKDRAGSVRVIGSSSRY